jgi:gamma-glutamyl phosphate reductase
MIRVARNSFEEVGSYVYQAEANYGQEYLDHTIAWCDTRSEAVELIRKYVAAHPECSAHPIELME